MSDRHTVRTKLRAGVPLWQLPLDEAKRTRWEQGMSSLRRPDEPFVGDPLVELHEELIDALNYYDEAVRQYAYHDIVVLGCLITTEKLVREELMRRSV